MQVVSVDEGMEPRTQRETLARWVLGIVTVMLMASMGGGFLLLPVLVPAHVWAARRSGSLGRVGWSLLPAASVAMVAWALVYVAVGESKPTIWLVPMLALAATFALLERLARGAAPVAG